MEFLKVIEERRSIRKYLDKDVDKELVLDILNCGRLAPSAKNRQPWFFVVVKNEVKDKIADMMIEYASKEDADGSIAHTADIMKQAPILILIFRENNKDWIIGDNLSIGACVENMCLRATDLGLGSLWIRNTFCVAKEVAEIIGYGDMELNCALALGYADQEPKMRPRKNLEDIVKWYDDKN